MNNPTFLTIARQGKNGWWRYLVGVLISIGVLLIFSAWVICIAWISFYLSGTSLKIDQNTINSFFYANPTRLLFLVALFGALLLLGLFVTMKFVHKRQFLTLISPDSTIDWFRIFKGLILWLGLYGINFLAWHLIIPSRYSLTFNLSEWLPFAAWGLILLPIFICTRVILINAYLLQGMGLVIRRPLILTIVWGFLLGSFQTNFKMPSFWIFNVIAAMFTTWIIIKDDRLELAMGMAIANTFYSLFIGFSDSTIKLPAVFQVSDDPLLLPSLLTYLIRASLFYLICFGWRRELPKAEPR
jgi:uncharacterized protein